MNLNVAVIGASGYAGAQLTALLSGHPAVKTLRLAVQSKPGAAISELFPGFIGGLETLRRIKAMRPDLPVILLTGHGSTKEGDEGMRLGAFDYLIKPLAINEIIQKIHEALAG